MPLNFFSFYKLIFFSILLVLISSCEDKPSKEFQFGIKMNQLFQDTNQNKKNDAVGYYLDNPKYYSFVYQEHDTNEDGVSDFFVWNGLATSNAPDQTEKFTVKVHEEEDTSKNGKIDTIRWLLPNEHVALTQTDKDGDGFFESTNYYNLQKRIVRTEVDSNKDGKPDRIFWRFRIEVDSDYDGVPDLFGVSDSDSELRKMSSDLKTLKPLKPSESWLLNSSLIPKTEKAIIQIEL